MGMPYFTISIIIENIGFSVALQIFDNLASFRESEED
jgi:hypothetical protein